MVRRFPLWDQLPSALHGVILNIHWDIGRLHGLTGLREIVVPVRDLSWHLHLPFWSIDGMPFRVSPFEVAQTPDRYRAQWDRTMAADLRFPPHVRTDATRDIVILDGVHRLLKATVLGQEALTVRLVTKDHLQSIAL
ncbi:hypothetical protein P5V93_13615 [Mycobacteroides abscessus subsp. abscessus]|uniref:hypothetical protein n=1 Tax=Mycobacteroides abscessus TaxID=36809 RepID=UPI00092C9988|nr:hypothetical protein [Mycobacteroides abscessus]MBN7550957.1 hypothetical protein [Mycobacteroides abscessus subsp. abscessus]MDM2421482.1 hypothetical protein [Mycobacteroides abscessus]MDM2427861.1 hypothetical protein [Mycobacteroides abscessus]MDM2432923.1 hypothetical protein [Mycobacteroides abscessus]MDM2435126.1 hypothetical protein [Mycobacteroides abscessus]